MSGINYVIMDGRAAYDVESACVLLAMCHANDDAAIAEFKADWSEIDAVLLRVTDCGLELIYV